MLRSPRLQIFKPLQITRIWWDNDSSSASGDGIIRCASDDAKSVFKIRQILTAQWHPGGFNIFIQRPVRRICSNRLKIQERILTTCRGSHRIVSFAINAADANRRRTIRLYNKAETQKRSEKYSHSSPIAEWRPPSLVRGPRLRAGIRPWRFPLVQSACSLCLDNKNVIIDRTLMSRKIVDNQHF